MDILCYLCAITKNRFVLFFPQRVFDTVGSFVKTEDSDPSHALTLQSLLTLMVLQLQQKVNGTILVSKYYCCVWVWFILWYFCLGWI